MLRLLLIVLVLAMVIALINRGRSIGKNHRDESEKLSSSKMVRCNYCQLHVTQDEALMSDGQYYCSIEHQEKAKIENLP
jgi:uncharacterized protein